MAKLVPFSGPFTKTELMHLIRRTMFGLKKADINHFKGKTLQQVVDELLAVPNTVPNPPLKTYYTRSNNVNIDNIDVNVPFGETWVNTGYPSNVNPNPNGNRRLSYKKWWTGLQVQQDRNIREKMVLFWHNHLATEDSVTEQAFMAYYTNVILRKHALGNFKQMVRDITLDPGMLRYLNGYLNTKAAPDENYGRELQELFCIGKGPGSQYTEDDVKAAAKVLTGWQIVTSENINGVTTAVKPYNKYTLSRHDVTDKKFSAFYNNTVIKGVATPKAGEERLEAEKEIDAMLTMMFNTQETAKYLCRRLWNYFVYYELNDDIETNVIEPLAEIFRTSNYEIKPVLQALFSCDYFYKVEHRGCMIKSPADFTVGIVRQFGWPIPTDPSKYEAQYVAWDSIRNFTVRQGLDLGDPPNVAGWPAYYQTPSFHEMWVDTSSYPERKSAYESLCINGMTTSANLFTDASKSIPIKFNFVDFVKQFENPQDPNALINEAVELLFGIDVSQSIKDTLKSNYLLLGQSSDYYWTDAYNTYVANPSTTDPEGKRVPTMLRDLFVYMQSAAEYHLC
jgi:hypothetical protein